MESLLIGGLLCVLGMVGVSFVAWALCAVGAMVDGRGK